MVTYRLKTTYLHDVTIDDRGSANTHLMHIMTELVPSDYITPSVERLTLDDVR